MSNDKTPPADKPKDNLTRIPVKQIWFPTDDYLDMPGVTSGQMSNLYCGKIGPDGKPNDTVSRWWTCDFIPAWQMFEVTHHIASAGEHTMILTPRSVKKWVRA